MSVTLANGGATRRFSDFYPTPADVTYTLLDYLKLPTRTTIWECAAGEGHMARAIESCGHFPVSSDLSTTGVDFLQEDETFAPWIITNPPFSRSAEFIRHAHKLRPSGGFAFLLKSQYWHATKRKALFEEIRPTEVLPLTWRPDFLFGAKIGAPTMEVLWTIWRFPYEAKQTIYLPLSRVIHAA